MLNNFSSIFELLCAYNLVNAITYSDEKSAFRFLDLANPLRNHLEDDLKKGTQLSNDLLESFKGESNSKTGFRFAKALLIGWFYRVNYRFLNYHENVFPKIYLIGGLFCFSYLLFGGFCESLQMVNNFSMVAWSTFGLYILFLLLGFTGAILSVKMPKLVKVSRVLIFSLFIVMLLSYFFNLAGFAVSIQKILIWVWLGVFFLLFLLLRRIIVSRKFFIASYCSIVFITPFFAKCTINFTHYYSARTVGTGIVYELNQEAATLLVICSIILALAPFLFDILYHSISMGISQLLNRLGMKLLNRTTIGNLDTNIDSLE